MGITYSFVPMLSTRTLHCTGCTDLCLSNRTCCADSKLFCFSVCHSVPTLCSLEKAGCSFLVASRTSVISIIAVKPRMLIPTCPRSKDMSRSRRSVSLLSSQEKRQETSAGSCKKTAAQGRSEPGPSAPSYNLNCFTVTSDGSCSSGGLKRNISWQIPGYIPNYSVLTVGGFAALIKRERVWKA